MASSAGLLSCSCEWSITRWASALARGDDEERDGGEKQVRLEVVEPAPALLAGEVVAPGLERAPVQGIGLRPHLEHHGVEVVGFEEVEEREGFVYARGTRNQVVEMSSERLVDLPATIDDVIDMGRVDAGR